MVLYKLGRKSTKCSPGALILLRGSLGASLVVFYKTSHQVQLSENTSQCKANFGAKLGLLKLLYKLGRNSTKSSPRARIPLGSLCQVPRSVSGGENWPQCNAGFWKLFSDSFCGNSLRSDIWKIFLSPSTKI